MTPVQALKDPRLAENMTIWRAARTYRNRSFGIELARMQSKDEMGIGSILLTLAAIYEDQ